MKPLTVLDVARSMGVELDRNAAWSVGATVRRLYETEVGELPPKDLRTKTSGAGSHCFAVYPPEWRDRIAEIIRNHRTEEARQTSLF